MNPKSPSATRALPDFKESDVSLIKPRVYRHRAVPAIDPFSFLKIPVVGITLCFDVGPWLSLVERLNGVQEVESSNLSGPISFFEYLSIFPLRRREPFYLLFGWGGVDSMFSFRRRSLKKRLKLSFYRPFVSVFFFGFTRTDRNLSSPFTLPC